MKRLQYIAPDTQVVKLNISDPVLEVGDLFEGSSEEDSHESWFGAKENGGIFDEEPFGNLWDDEPVDDPFSTGE